MVTFERPDEEEERISSMPGTVLTAPSMMSVISVSISCGAAPVLEVEMETVGISIFREAVNAKRKERDPPMTVRMRMMTVAKRDAAHKFQPALHITSSACKFSVLSFQFQKKAICLTETENSKLKTVIAEPALLHKVAEGCWSPPHHRLRRPRESGIWSDSSCPICTTRNLATSLE